MVTVFVLRTNDGQELAPMITRDVYDAVVARINAEHGAGSAFVESRDWPTPAPVSSIPTGWSGGHAHLLSPCPVMCRAGTCEHAVKMDPNSERWFVTMGHAGFNTRANNGRGYASKAAAIAIVRRHSGAR